MSSVDVSSVENGNESMRVSGGENGSINATAMVNVGDIEDEGHMDQVILIHNKAHDVIRLDLWTQARVGGTFACLWTRATFWVFALVTMAWEVNWQP